MAANVEEYRQRLDNLIRDGRLLHGALAKAAYPDSFIELLGKDISPEDLPNFLGRYQTWYSEAREVVKLLLKDRLDDFIYYYKAPQSRKRLDHGSYHIEDYLNLIPRSEKSEGFTQEAVSVFVKFIQQLQILKSVSLRFENSLLDMRQMMQADIFDSEIDAARELLKHKFLRAAGAMAGVILEKHLAEVVKNHNISIGRRKQSIANLNDALRDANVLQTPEWRGIQSLADIRNLCAHNNKIEPTEDQILELINSVDKLTKTLF